VYEFNGTFHGKYNLKDGGEAHLFYNGESKMCIKMVSNGEEYYLSMTNDKDTEDVKAMIEDVKANGWEAVKSKYMPAEK